jgi:hypothetical protein
MERTYSKSLQQHRCSGLTGLPGTSTANRFSSELRLAEQVAAADYSVQRQRITQNEWVFKNGEMV